MKKFYVYLCAFCLVLCAFAGCTGKNKTSATKLGNTEFSMVIPEGYVLSTENMDEDQIAYYNKDSESVDFDIYAWEKDSSTLKEFTEKEAAEYNSIANPVTVNGNKGMLYISEEEFDGTIWTVYNYSFEDSSNMVEICFWTDNSQEELDVIDSIINTLSE